MAYRYRERLEKVLGDLPDNDDAIIRQEGLALLYQLNGKLADAIGHRQREIRLMERLHREAQSPQYAGSTRVYSLKDRGSAELAQRRAILEFLRSAVAKEPFACHSQP